MKFHLFQISLLLQWKKIFFFYLKFVKFFTIILIQLRGSLDCLKWNETRKESSRFHPSLLPLVSATPFWLHRWKTLVARSRRNYWPTVLIYGVHFPGDCRRERPLSLSLWRDFFAAGCRSTIYCMSAERWTRRW